MLIEFRISNYRSIKDEQALSMEAAPIGSDDEHPIPRQVEGHNKKLLPAVALYGANASGKTNVIRGLTFFHDAVINSAAAWKPDQPIAREPFAWGTSASEPTLFEIQFILAGCKYEYGFVANDSRFVEEWLYAYPSHRKQIWFERDEAGFKFGEHLRGENETIERLTRPNSLFLSAAAQFKHEQLAAVLAWIQWWQVRDILAPGFYRLFSIDFQPVLLHMWANAFGNPNVSAPIAAQLDTRKAALLSLLKEADLGVEELRFDSLNKAKPSEQRILLRHPKGWLPLEEESKGTRTLAHLAPHIVDALDRGTLFLIDEIEASLHPLLALKLVKLFSDPKTNPRNAQLIFTTHDTLLLGRPDGEPLLRRDQVWFTEKDKEDATHLYPLTDFMPRKSENLERGYLQGRYGAIPVLGDLLPGGSNYGKT